MLSLSETVPSKAKVAARKLRGIIGPPGRTVATRPEDVFLVSYPKSGNMLLRFLLGNLLSPEEPVDFANIEAKVPDIYRSRKKYLRKLSSPRVLKSHEYFDPRYQRVVYLVRDPRDVAVSYYYYLIKVRSIEEDYPMDRHLSRFVSGDLDGYGSWGENVGSWLGARLNNDRFLMLRYEDILKRPEQEVLKMVEFLSMDVSEERLCEAVKLSSADRMRVLENSQDWKPMRKSGKDKAFVRFAGAGGWRSELSETGAFRIEKEWGEIMREVGYLP